MLRANVARMQSSAIGPAGAASETPNGSPLRNSRGAASTYPALVVTRSCC